MNKNEMREVIQKWNEQQGTFSDMVDAFIFLFHPMDPDTTMPELLCWFMIVSQKLKHQAMKAFEQKALIPYLEPGWHDLAKLRLEAIWLGAKDLIRELEKNSDKSSAEVLTLFKKAVMLQYDLMREFIPEIEQAYSKANAKREAKIRQALDVGMGIYQKGEEV
jgi:hypothetical protein